MAETVMMPTMGSTIRTAYITKWYKQEGESILQGEPLLEVLTKKTIFQVEAPVTGSVHKLLVPEKTALPLDIPLVILAEEGDDAAKLQHMVVEAEDALSKAPPIDPDLATVIIPSNQSA
jgi:pyruvate dehydrogenase E2 component (dihydrolipoamide acetyltransferase)